MDDQQTHCSFGQQCRLVTGISAGTVTHLPMQLLGCTCYPTTITVNPKPSAALSQSNMRVIPSAHNLA